MTFAVDWALNNNYRSIYPFPSLPSFISAFSGVIHIIVAMHHHCFYHDGHRSSSAGSASSPSLFDSMPSSYLVCLVSLPCSPAPPPPPPPSSSPASFVTVFIVDIVIVVNVPLDQVDWALNNNYLSIYLLDHLIVLSTLPLLPRSFLLLLLYMLLEQRMSRCPIFALLLPCFGNNKISLLFRRIGKLGLRVLNMIYALYTSIAFSERFF